MSPPLLPITAQAVVLSVVSSLLAQLLAADWRASSALRFDPWAADWPAVAKFAVFTALVTPPNVLWQDYLERLFPGTRPAAEPSAHKQEGDKQGADEQGADKKARAPDSAPSLHVPNTVAKTLLDQTAGACVNTFLFCAFMASWALLVDADAAAGRLSLARWTAAVAAALRADFAGMLKAGWRFWPLVSLGNFALVPDVATRNLVGGLAGIVWGVYVNLATARPPPAAAKDA